MKNKNRKNLIIVTLMIGLIFISLLLSSLKSFGFEFVLRSVSFSISLLDPKKLYRRSYQDYKSALSELGGTLHED